VTEPSSLAIVLAGLGGAHGNGARLVELAAPHLSSVQTELCVLASRPGFGAHEGALRRASGFVFVTGTYWDGWSSHLQRFLEEATPTEATSLWLGKPAAVWVTAHSVGGKGVLSRLTGVLSSFGCTIPPMSGLVVTQANELARAEDPDAARDLWGPDDLEVATHNLLEAVRGTRRYRAWEVDRGDPARRWLG
jgi:NAD(P)H-dependent FMN reductase